MSSLPTRRTRTAHSPLSWANANSILQITLSIKGFFHFSSGHAVVLTLVSLRVEHSNTLVDHVLLAISQQHVTCLSRDENLWHVTKTCVFLLCLASRLEDLHLIYLLVGVPVNHMELLVSWSHLLHKRVSDGVATCHLRKQLGPVRVQVLDDGLFARLVINDSSSCLGLESHGHCHRSCLCLVRILSVELFVLDGSLIEMASSVVKDDDSHSVLELLRVLELNLKATSSNLVFRLCSGSSKILKVLGELILRGDDGSTLLGHFIGCTWCLYLKVDLFVHVLVGHNLLQTFLSYLLSMGLLFSSVLEHRDISLGKFLFSFSVLRQRLGFDLLLRLFHFGLDLLLFLNKGLLLSCLLLLFLGKKSLHSGL